LSPDRSMAADPLNKNWARKLRASIPTRDEYVPDSPTQTPSADAKGKDAGGGSTAGQSANRPTLQSTEKHATAAADVDFLESASKSGQRVEGERGGESARTAAFVDDSERGEGAKRSTLIAAEAKEMTNGGVDAPRRQEVAAVAGDSSGQTMATAARAATPAASGVSSESAPPTPASSKTPATPVRHSAAAGVTFAGAITPPHGLFLELILTQQMRRLQLLQCVIDPRTVGTS
jgi:hypothetical protein